MIRQLAIRGFKTIKSNKDELKDQTVLGLLKRIPALNERRTKIEPKPEARSPDVTVSFDQLTKILDMHTADPLTWDVQTLSRIFRLPHGHCECILTYVLPLTRYLNNEMDEAVEFKTRSSIVVDVARLKVDKNYFSEVQCIKFIGDDETVTPQNSAALDDKARGIKSS